MKKSIATSWIFLTLSVSAMQVSGENLLSAEEKERYRNQILDCNVPDPTVIRADNGYYYLYGTESDIRNIPIFKSADLVNWEFVGTAFTDESRPAWDSSNHRLWAPEIRYIDSKYVLYYSFAKWGDEWNSNVGVAVAGSPEGPFTDHGCLIDADDPAINVQNSIDQFHIEENGKHYLFWGSFRGIYVVELENDGLSVKCNADGTPVMKQKVCGTAFEGVNLYKKGGYYYLFASVGSCCEGDRSTYTTVVGRSEKLLEPYTDKKGGKMLDNCYETLISGNEFWAGTGHNSIIQLDDAGQEWIIYHSYVRQQPEKGRVVLLDKLLWDEDGWPYVQGGIPSETEEYPVIDTDRILHQ